MRFWLDNHLSPALCAWISKNFGVEAVAIRDLGMARADDEDVFAAAGQAGPTLVTKDADFVNILERRGPPPQVLWLTFGNTSTARVQAIFLARLPSAIMLLEQGEPLVEISDLD